MLCKFKADKLSKIAVTATGVKQPCFDLTDVVGDGDGGNGGGGGGLNWLRASVNDG